MPKIFRSEIEASFFKYLSKIWDRLPQNDRDFLTEYWRGLLRANSDEYLNYLQAESASGILTISPYEVRKWRPIEVRKVLELISAEEDGLTTNFPSGKQDPFHFEQGILRLEHLYKGGQSLVFEFDPVIEQPEVFTMEFEAKFPIVGREDVIATENGTITGIVPVDRGRLIENTYGPNPEDVERLFVSSAKRLVTIDDPITGERRTLRIGDELTNGSPVAAADELFVGFTDNTNARGSAIGISLGNLDPDFLEGSSRTTLGEYLVVDGTAAVSGNNGVSIDPFRFRVNDVNFNDYIEDVSKINVLVVSGLNSHDGIFRVLSVQNRSTLVLDSDFPSVEQDLSFELYAEQELKPREAPVEGGLSSEGFANGHNPSLSALTQQLRGQFLKGGQAAVEPAVSATYTHVYLLLDSVVEPLEQTPQFNIYLGRQNQNYQKINVDPIDLVELDFSPGTYQLPFSADGITLEAGEWLKVQPVDPGTEYTFSDVFQPMRLVNQARRLGTEWVDNPQSFGLKLLRSGQGGVDDSIVLERVTSSRLAFIFGQEFDFTEYHKYRLTIEDIVSAGEIVGRTLQLYVDDLPVFINESTGESTPTTFNTEVSRTFGGFGLFSLSGGSGLDAFIRNVKFTKFNIDERIVELPALYDRYEIQTQVLEVGEDYDINDRGILRLKSLDSPELGIDVVDQDILIGEYVSYALNRIEANYGQLVGVYGEDSPALKNKAAAVWSALLDGPLVDSVKKGVQAFVGLPITLSDGFVTGDGSSLDSLEIDGIKYRFPESVGVGINPRTNRPYAKGDFVPAFSPVAGGVTIRDYLVQRDWWYGELNAGFHELGKYHFFEVEIDDRLFDSDTAQSVNDFLSRIKALGEDFAVVALNETVETLVVEGNLERVSLLDEDPNKVFIGDSSDAALVCTPYISPTILPNTFGAGAYGSFDVLEAQTAFGLGGAATVIPGVINQAGITNGGFGDPDEAFVDLIEIVSSASGETLAPSPFLIGVTGNVPAATPDRFVSDSGVNFREEGVKVGDTVFNLSVSPTQVVGFATSNPGFSVENDTLLLFHTVADGPDTIDVQHPVATDFRDLSVNFPDAGVVPGDRLVLNDSVFVGTYNITEIVSPNVIRINPTYGDFSGTPVGTIDYDIIRPIFAGDPGEAFIVAGGLAVREGAILRVTADSFPEGLALVGNKPQADPNTPAQFSVDEILATLQYSDGTSRIPGATAFTETLDVDLRDFGILQERPRRVCIRTISTKGPNSSLNISAIPDINAAIDLFIAPDEYIGHFTYPGDEHLEGGIEPNDAVFGSYWGEHTRGGVLQVPPLNEVTDESTDERKRALDFTKPGDPGFNVFADVLIDDGFTVRRDLFTLPVASFEYQLKDFDYNDLRNGQMYQAPFSNGAQFGSFYSDFVYPSIPYDTVFLNAQARQSGVVELPVLLEDPAPKISELITFVANPTELTNLDDDGDGTIDRLDVPTQVLFFEWQDFIVNGENRVRVGDYVFVDATSQFYPVVEVITQENLRVETTGLTPITPGPILDAYIHGLPAEGDVLILDKFDNAVDREVYPIFQGEILVITSIVGNSVALGRPNVNGSLDTIEFGADGVFPIEGRIVRTPSPFSRNPAIPFRRTNRVNEAYNIGADDIRFLEDSVDIEIFFPATAATVTFNYYIPEDLLTEINAVIEPDEVNPIAVDLDLGSRFVETTKYDGSVAFTNDGIIDGVAGLPVTEDVSRVVGTGDIVAANKFLADVDLFAEGVRVGDTLQISDSSLGNDGLYEIALIDSTIIDNDTLFVATTSLVGESSVAYAVVGSSFFVAKDEFVEASDTPITTHIISPKNLLSSTWANATVPFPFLTNSTVFVSGGNDEARVDNVDVIANRGAAVASFEADGIVSGKFLFRSAGISGDPIAAIVARYSGSQKMLYLQYRNAGTGMRLYRIDKTQAAPNDVVELQVVYPGNFVNTEFEMGLILDGDNVTPFFNGFEYPTIVENQNQFEARHGFKLGYAPNNGMDEEDSAIKEFNFSKKFVV